MDKILQAEYICMGWITHFYKVIDFSTMKIAAYCWMNWENVVRGFYERCWQGGAPFVVTLFATIGSLLGSRVAPWQCETTTAVIRNILPNV